MIMKVQYKENSNVPTLSLTHNDEGGSLFSVINNEI